MSTVNTGVPMGDMFIAETKYTTVGKLKYRGRIYFVFIVSYPGGGIPLRVSPKIRGPRHSITHIKR